MKSIRGRVWSRCLTLALLASSACAVASAPARATTLSELVPADAGLYIEFDNLAKHARTFLDSELHQRLVALPPLAAWREENSVPLDKLADAIARQLDIEPEEFWNKLLSRKAAVAVWPGADSPESGLFLLEASDQALLERAMAALAAAHRRAGDLMNEGEFEHAGLKYRVRVLDRGDVELRICVATLGPIGVLTGDEEVMKQVLELHAGADDAPPSLAASEFFVAGSARWKPAAAVKMFVNPRAFDEQMAADLASLEDSAIGDRVSPPFLRQAIVDAWRASDYWVTSVEVGRRVAVDSFFHLDHQRLSPPLGEVIDSFRGEAEFLNRVPPDAFFAFAGRVNLGHLSQLFLAGGDDANLENFDDVRDMARGLLLGLDLFDDVLTSLGPDLGAYLAPGKTAGPGDEGAAEVDERPIDLVLGVEVQPRAEGDDRPSAKEALNSALRAGMTLAVNFGNQRRDPDEPRAKLSQTTVDDVKLTTLEGANLLPEGLMATYGFVDDYLLFGSSVEAVSRSLAARPEDSLAHSPEVARVLGDGMSLPGQVLFIRCDEFREFLETRRRFFASVVSMTRGLDRETTQRGLDQLSDVLRLAETVAVAARFDDDGLSVSIGLITSQDDGE